MTEEHIRFAAIFAASLAMLSGLVFVFCLLKRKQQGLGPNSLKALGLILFLPALLIISIVSPDFKTETLAALLGTVAGYVLSHSKSDDN